MTAPRKPSRFEFAALRAWHAVLAGGYLVAYVTGDEDTYAMHLFSGYVVLGAIVLRLLAGLAAPAGSPLALPRPRLGGPGRNPLFAWFAAALLVVLGVAAVSGALADGVAWLEDPHEAVAEASLPLIFAHIAFVTFVYGGKRLLGRLRGAVAALLIAAAFVPVAHAADPRAVILDDFARQARAADPAFAGFSAERGEKVFRTRWAGGDERTPSCTACHTDDPRQPGKNAKTGRPIEPVAVSANPKRFTDRDEVEKQFERDCKSVMGRPCTALERGDYITFMMGR